MKVLVSDPLGQGGMDIFRKEKNIQVDEKVGLKPEELIKIIGDYDALVVRSATKVTKEVIEAGKKLRVIGRAGVGVDNVDLEAATKQGIIVMNTPEGNTISTAELSFSMLMAVARNIPQADAHVKKGEWKRNKFQGSELNGKTLGIVGFGRIGREVAKRANAFNMKVMVFDPFISKEAVKEWPVEFVDVPSLLKSSDFITFHTPLTNETRNILNRETFKLCKKGMRIVNCARGGIVDEAALAEAIQSGQIAGAAFDVFVNEPPAADNPLLKLPQFICTPHVGAVTAEAQENVAVDVAKQVIDALNDRAIRNAVNLPNLDPDTLKGLKPWLVLAEKIGMLYTQLFEGSIKKVEIRYGGDPTRFKTAALTIATLKGLLKPICGDTVNFVNAPAIAKQRGITVTEGYSTETGDFASFIDVEVTQGKEVHRIMGTLFSNQLPRIVRINEFMIDVEPEGWVLFVRNQDLPGVVGTIGTVLGRNGVNIAEMSLGRFGKGKKAFAMTVINTDSEVPAKVLAQIKKTKSVLDVKVVKF
ncbi:MAG TPA: phosphoglycerate dehydrogenase [Candidatus Omnitrophota bacterium]|nr:phosphoglycerate dehydrogenase [Candidatus Omnitrophota bacterium]HPS37701.1 phosphoglycerate dehydrogenase [Candidatus Omnitrophota bacterium]